MYDTTIGRFLERDPKRMGDSSLYELANGSPTGLLDPGGEAVFKGWEGWIVYPHHTPYPFNKGVLSKGEFPKGIYTTPPLEKGNPREGPYLGTEKADFSAFYLSIEYRTHCGPCQPPQQKERPPTGQDYGNSGIYIYDRWEVQIVDPSQRDKGPKMGEAIPGGEGPNAPNVSTPGNPYGVGNRKEYKNWAKCCGNDNWNKLEIWFTPTGKGGRLKTRLNDHVVFDGNLSNTSTGQNKVRAGNPLTRGPIFIQSHWGCKVDFKNPLVLTEADIPPR